MADFQNCQKSLISKMIKVGNLKLSKSNHIEIADFENFQKSRIFKYGKNSSKLFISTNKLFGLKNDNYEKKMKILGKKV